MKPWNTLLTLSVATLCWMPVAHAELFKCVGADGKITYSETKEAKSQCTPVTTQITVVPAPPRVATPPSKSAESGSAERETKADVAKQIAEQERALAEAKKALAEQESIRLGSEQNYQRVLDRLKPYQDKVSEIEKKLAQLREEPSKSK